MKIHRHCIYIGLQHSVINCIIFMLFTVYLHGPPSSPGPYIPPYCRMAGQLRPPPAHQPLPAHFNSATHIAMRPGKTHVESVLNLLDCRDKS